MWFFRSVLSWDVPNVKRVFLGQLAIKVILVLIERGGSPGVISIIVHALLSSINQRTKRNVTNSSHTLDVDTLSYLIFRTLIL